MFAQTAYAQFSQSGLESGTVLGFHELIIVGIAILLFVSVVLTIIFMLWGGFLLILSGGKEEKVKPAVSMIRYSVIGLLVIIMIVMLTPYITRLFGVGEIGNLFSPTRIFNTMGCVKDRVINQSQKNCFQQSTITSGGYYDARSTTGSLGSDFTDI